jgi:hypothetical protein
MQMLAEFLKCKTKSTLDISAYILEKISMTYYILYILR